MSETDQEPRIRGLAAVVGLLFTILVLRLFYLQIATSEDYLRESDDNRIDKMRIKAPRGLIMARDGEILAQNGAFYTISLIRSTKGNFEAAVNALHEAIGGPPIAGRYTKKSSSIRLKRDVDFRTVAIVEEVLKDEWPMAIEIEAKRNYPADRLAAHLIGYMGLPQEQEQAADFLGITGVEKLYEHTLRGIDGVRFVEVDARNRIRRDFPDEEKPSVSGQNLVLTIDYDIQRAAEHALPDSVPGSVVALDARTGAVLAMVSKPAFDPNIFISFQDQEQRLQVINSPTEPLLNRATKGTYPPGSTLKLIGAVAALETGITDTLSTFEACAGSLQVGDTTFRCFKRDGHGELNLLEAVETSCNIYFLHLAQLLGMETWRDYAQRFGFGESTGINLYPEDEAGLLPDRQYYVETEGWTQGHLMNLVIGQGSILTTPLQVARYPAALGNGGHLVSPHIAGPAPATTAIQDVSDATLDVIRRCMRRVVYGKRGTGRRAWVADVEVAGKSGTAQVPNRNDDAWFVSFAPYDDPTIAVAVVVEGGGSGGLVAAPIASKVMDAHFAQQRSALLREDDRPLSLAVADTGNGP